MNVLIGCERFGIIRDEFAKRGHNAWSCDLVEAPGKHFKEDVRSVATRYAWDIFIVHPDCTYLTVANTYMKRGCSKYTAEQAVELREGAIEFFMECVALCEKIGKGVIENPVGVMSTTYRKPDQIIQPWQFGDDASKKTCLWLFGLPPLTHTSFLVGTRHVGRTRHHQGRTTSDLRLNARCFEQRRTPASRQQWPRRGAEA